MSNASTSTGSVRAATVLTRPVHAAAAVSIQRVRNDIVVIVTSVPLTRRMLSCSPSTVSGSTCRGGRQTLLCTVDSPRTRTCPAFGFLTGDPLGSASPPDYAPPSSPTTPVADRIGCTGRRDVRLPSGYLGAGDRAGANYTGQPVVHSYYADDH
ncbi:hypothetical protein LADH09A_005352 [Micromonospora sp. LAH09]|uniref:hypothetical protein n=1 Tax=Micromonospora cabrerizensis TaxID=2911213 RepID=UPI001EE877A1|nr:hypothetical protein [Micromonospora cabrerizensis]MCG5471362.1 hypothetical protein [Micromonospora cabrerizensis]